MKIHRIFFLLNGIWELLRFLLLFLALGITFQWTLVSDRQAIFWLVVLGNANLLMPAAALLLYIDARRFRVLLNLLRLGKLLGLFSSALLIILEPVSSGLRQLSLSFLPFAIAPLSILLLIAVIDLVFIFLLFSCRIEQNENEKQNSSLPDYRVTVLHNSAMQEEEKKL